VFNLAEMILLLKSTVMNLKTNQPVKLTKIAVLPILLIIIFPHVAFSQKSPANILPISRNRSATDSKDQLDKSIPTKFIVRLQNDPLYKKTSTGARLSVASNLEGEHQKFISDFNALEKKSNTRARSSSKITFEYRNTFNGFAIEASPEFIEEIKKLPSVISVTVDQKIKVLDTNSNKIINAPAVWSSYNVTGKGVKVGIIDTGVDYMHSDLGSGIGSGFKIRDGYNFANSINDPIDWDGHGTHVAGIIAANGPGLKGVAPDALIYAYRVFTSSGYSYNSWVIAAIERTVDPDQNPSTNDALDVVNISLGGPDVSLDNPVVIAVENAIESGVVFVISAGNDIGFNSISYIATAPHAITVGATDNHDATAYFSSKGPTSHGYFLKPDISAPGLDIYSTFLNNEHVTMSGTSMSAPHVTGAVALLLEKHPDWTPEMVKSVLMQTAKKSNENIFMQGAGRIDVLKAIQADFILTPASISLGALSTISSPVETQIQIHNQSAEAKIFNLSAQGKIVHPDITITFDKDQVTVAPNTTEDVTITFDIKPTLAHIGFPECYDGSIMASADGVSLQSLVTLVNSRSLKIVFQDYLPEKFAVIGVHQKGAGLTPNINSETVVLLPEGPVDLASITNGSIIIKENIKGGVADSIVYFNPADAKNTITFQPKNKLGNSIISNQGTTTFRGKGRDFLWTYSISSHTFYISDLKNYFLDCEFQHDNSNKDFYDIILTTPTPLTSDKTISNDPSELSEIEIYNPTLPDGTDQTLSLFDQISFLNGWEPVFGTVSNPFRIYQTPRDPDDYQDNEVSNVPKFISIQLKSKNIFNGPATWQTNWFEAKNNQTISFYDRVKKPITLSAIQDKFKYNLGEGIVRINQTTSNHDNIIELIEYDEIGTFNAFLGERENKSIVYELKDESGTIHSDDFNNSIIHDPQTQHIYYEVQSGKYSLNMIYEYLHADKSEGTAIADLQFTLGGQDQNPPRIMNISFTKNEKALNSSIVDHETVLNVSLADHCFNTTCKDTNTGIRSVIVKVKQNENDEWTDLSLTKLTPKDQTEFYKGNLNLLSNGVYDLKITATDLSDNTLTYSISKAFELIETIDGFSDVIYPSFLIYPNPIENQGILQYHLQKPGTAEISIVDILGKEVKGFSMSHITNGYHSLILNRDQFNSAGIYIVTLKTENTKKSIKLFVK
jgi:hypothetical protein